MVRTFMATLTGIAHFFDFSDRQATFGVVRVMRVIVTVTVTVSAVPCVVTRGVRDARVRSWTVRATSMARCPSARTQRTSTCQPEPSGSRTTRMPDSGEANLLSAAPGLAREAARARRLARVGCRARTPLTARAASAAVWRMSAG